MSAFRALHLSDIHIGKTYIKSEEIAYKIVYDITHNGLCNVRSVVVTGDVFDGQVQVNEKLINEAVNFFDILLEQINLNQDEYKLTKDDFIFVPGNHDLIRVDDYELRWSKYKNFLKGFYVNIPEYYNTKNYSVLRPYYEEKIVFIGFNSCQIEKKKIFDKKYLNMIDKNVKAETLAQRGIDKKQLIELLEKEVANEYDDYGEISLAQIADLERQIRKLNGYNVVALLHHHFYLFPEVAQKYGDSSLVRNYTALIQHLKYMNVKTVLHGHKHFDLERPFITDDYYETTESIIDVFAGGSVGTDRKDRHTFSIIDFYKQRDDIKLIQNKFIYNEESLEPISRKQIPSKNISHRVIKLLDILKSANYDAYMEYMISSEKIFKIYKTCNEIINWTSEAITGFQDVYKYLDTDYKNILFLLYAINYRTLSYKSIIEKDAQYLEYASSILKELFNDLLLSSDFDISAADFHSLFTIKKLTHLRDKCNQLLSNSTNKIARQYLVFSMIGIFFSDLYLVFTEYADDFYNENIKYKVNIKMEKNKFHENVPAPRIAIESDADKRSVYIQLLCNEATAHKIAVLFVKEFDLIINKFQDYFKLIGFKLYHLIPKIDKNNLKDTLDNYNFEAYIPTLLPLLTGDNIYSSKEVFARELIQNSIDAIAVREVKEKIDFPKLIYIEIGKDENSRPYFKIKDNGTGMDRYKIERYFTSIGRSFYSDDEYENLNISYKPISNFGIGFLSSFMVCREIEVKTKYFLPDSECLKLHIPNYDGCFFIERGEDIDIGTEIKLYLNRDVDINKILEYIKKVMLDIKYDIIINYKNEKGEELAKIPAHYVRKNDEIKIFQFFVPFKENGDVLNIDWKKEVLSNNFINKYKYGFLIKPNLNNVDDNYSEAILNAGIRVEQTSLNVLFGDKFNQRGYENESMYNNIFINFPANWIQIDISREKINGFSGIIRKSDDKNPENTVGIRIAEAIYNQLLCFLSYSKENSVSIPSMCLQEIIQYAICLCGRKNSSAYQKLLNLANVRRVK
ncbi:ATP-binding protein [Clostridium sp. WILCCON 0269]|uniref:ATP-binding protein n=1 Tax=Candidatus Clostridium eludens TaxID=3381663 RepID=A0ABW8SKL9_9CLOT